MFNLISRIILAVFIVTLVCGLFVHFKELAVAEMCNVEFAKYKIEQTFSSTSKEAFAVDFEAILDYIKNSNGTVKSCTWYQ